MLQKYPGMDTTQKKQLDDFVNTQALTALTASGDINFQDFAKSNPIEAYGLRNAGFNPTENAPLTAKQLEQKDKQSKSFKIGL